MAEKPPPRVAVVGRNVSAALWVQTLRELHPTAEISWYRHASERDPHGIPAWVLVRDSVKQKIPTAVPTLKIDEPWVFLERSRRVPGSVFSSENLRSVDGGRIYQAIRNKWMAMGLYNDLSPSLWKGSSPDPDWIRKAPLSFKTTDVESLWLVPREAALSAWETQFKNVNVRLMPNDCGVFGIEANLFTEPHRLLHNAPFGFSQADRVIWTSALQSFKVDSEKKAWKKLKAPQQHTGAQWVSRTTRVPESRVTGLPVFSLWLDPTNGKEFLETGLWKSGCLKRVICLPPSLTGDRQGNAWLQIEELISQSHPHAITHSVDGFLAGLCPNLSQAPRQYTEWRFEEGCLFEDPRARHSTLGRGIEFWHASGIGDPIPAATRWQLRHLPLKKRA